MTPPRLNRRLSLERPVRTPDGAGGFAPGWQPVGTVWAEIRPRSGREADGAPGALSLQACRIVMPAAPVGSPRRPAPDHRFREGPRVFVVLAVTEMDPGGRYLICEAREEVIA
ncbi:tail protein [Wenxinia marina]|uniref:head-tail adaptor protein n=1 Tax=Wenxinia marina TaxID=390641 RepID=UPI00036D3255|nr:head-tail adaptor protein [Wenxinia marina]GGL62297.1 tail protein [Wenxinia marina]